MDNAGIWITALLTLFVLLGTTRTVQERRRKAKLKDIERARKMQRGVDYCDKLLNLPNITIPTPMQKLLHHRALSILNRMKTLHDVKSVRQAVNMREALLQNIGINIDSSKVYDLPTNQDLRTAALQDMFILGQFLQKERLRADVNTQEVLTETRRIEVSMLVSKVNEAVKKGDRALGKRELGTARSQFERVLELFRSYVQYQEEIQPYFDTAKSKLDEIHAIMTGNERPRPVAVAAPSNAQPKEQEDTPQGDGLDRMFSDKKQRIAL